MYRKLTLFILKVVQQTEIAPGNIHLFIDDVAIEQKTHTKFLGVVINENLNWSNHVKYISTPIARSIGVLRKLRYFLPVSTPFYVV